MMKIVVDAMGGDNAPYEIVKGAIESLGKDKDFGIILTGEQKAIEEELSKYKYDSSRVEIVPCSEVITNDDIPTKAIRNKKDSSLVVAFNLLKNNPDVGGLISAGSTGAVLTAGILMIGRIRGISRPALCPLLPNSRGTRTLLCDCGANLDCKPVNLVHFALMGSAYAKVAYNIENPIVGLVTNGTEEHKGDELHQQAYALLKQIDCINFEGNVEGRDIMYGNIDVAVADGFTGNIAMKSIEGCGKAVSVMMKNAYTKNLGRKIAAAVSLAAIKELKNSLDYHKYGGAMLLGIKKIVVKSHGSSKAKSIVPSILLALKSARNDLVGAIQTNLAGVDFDAIGKDE